MLSYLYSLEVRSYYLDGNTFIQIVPINAKVKIEPGKIENTENQNGNIIENKTVID